jgi:hypothetical protein
MSVWSTAIAGIAVALWSDVRPKCQLVAQVDRRLELAGLSRSIEDFCERIRTGLQQATFDQKRKLVELLIDRVIVSDGEVEIRYPSWVRLRDHSDGGV